MPRSRNPSNAKVAKGDQLQKKTKTKATGGKNKMQASLVRLPEGAIGLKKPKIKAKKPKDCAGARKGSFERLLRFSSHLVFGSKASVRTQDELKQTMQETIEKIMQGIIRESLIRRVENNGRRLMATNVAGAFRAWSKTVGDEFCHQYWLVNQLTAPYTVEMMHAEKKEAAKQAKARSKKFRSSVQHLLESNASALKGEQKPYDLHGADMEAKIDFGHLKSKMDKRRFIMLLQSQLESANLDTFKQKMQSVK